MALGKDLWRIYLSGFFLALHYATVVYVNSSLLTKFFLDSTINTLYIVGSILGLILLSLAPFLVKKYNRNLVFAFFISLEIFAVFGLGKLNTALFVAYLFLMHQAAEFVLAFCLDLNLEEQTGVESTTGRKRGAYITIQNIAWVLSPFIVSLLITASDYSRVYFLSSLSLLPLLILAFFYKSKTKKSTSDQSNLIKTVKFLAKHKDHAKIIGSQFILNFFYSWMVIYMPLLLSKEMGFEWKEMGLLFTIMLLPFLLFELPAGIIGDKKTGEKEIMIFGFLTMFFSTLLIPNLNLPIFWLWALVLFVTRIGASLVEISTESYFFKHVKVGDGSLISIFRMMRPFSFIIAPLLAIPVVSFFSYSISFYFLSFFTLLGLLFIPKVDTR